MKKKFGIILSSFLLAFVGAFFAIGIKCINHKQASAYGISDTTSFATVGELWRGDGWDKTNVNRLLKLVSGDSSVSTDNYNLIKTQATATKTAQDMRTTEVLDKTNAQGIVVKIGGLDWTVTYLSNTRSDNPDIPARPILTLWLANGNQLNGKLYHKEGETTKTFDGNGKATWNSGYSPTNTFNESYPVPDNMYATSYMRCVVLNNGGSYSTAQGGTTHAKYEQNQESVFAPFTMKSLANDGSVIADYIVAPSENSWQETGQILKNVFPENNPTRSNENYSEEMPDSVFDAPIRNYARVKATFGEEIISSGDWKKDLLWLPSYCEVGKYSDGTDGHSGIWRTASNQRYSDYNETWTRSTASANYSMSVTISSSSAYDRGLNSSYTTRPAFHLDINKVMENLVEDYEVDELWDSTDNKINTSNLQILYKLIANDENADYDAIYNLVKDGETLTSADFRKITTTGENAKRDSQDIIVKLGGLYWTATYLSTDTRGNAILTLWLNDSSQLSGGRYDADKTFDEAGRSTWNSGFGASNTDYDWGNAIYGISYLRAVTLNNGGRYKDANGNSLNGYYVQSEENIFSTFTMKPNALGSNLADYLVTPKYVDWQKDGEYARTESGQPYNNPGDYWWKLHTIANTSSWYYSNRHGYSEWKDDVIWLPSIGETGYNETYDGLWELNKNQRSNTASFTWLRNEIRGTHSNAYYLSNIETTGSQAVSYSYAVRPALHLNLNVENVIDENKEDTTSTYVKVEDLWDSKNNKMDYQNVTELMAYLTGNDEASFGNVYDSARAKKTANDLRSLTASGKASGQDIVVALGGLDWTVTYLSTDKNGDPILTLWLNNSNQLNGVAYSADGNFNGYGYATWNSKYIPNDVVSATYPDSMYGTSFISSVVLNNGGYYITQNNDPNSLTNYTQIGDSVFSKFTIPSEDNTSIADFIVTPSQVTWQENGQSSKTTLSTSYNSANENWSTSLGNGNFYVNPYRPSGVYYNYAGKSRSSDWNNDYLWLPSLTETGFSDEKSGLWQLSNAQRSNISSSWLRSGYELTANDAYFLNSTGNGYDYDLVNQNHSVRPALHLNLSLVFASVAQVKESDNYTKVGELWNSSTRKMNGDNVSSLLKYITGDNTVGYSEINEMAKTTKNANDFRTANSKDILVTLGGLNWTPTYLSTDKQGNPILTLWLANDYQSLWETNSYSNSDNDKLVNGMMLSRYSGWKLNGASVGQYQDTMYGTSYIRAVALNNGGAYTSNTNTVKYAGLNENSAFANFTMKMKNSEGNYETNAYSDLIDFITKPINVSWQETERFYEIYGSGNNYSNEAWSDTLGNTNFADGTNFTGRVGNGIWRSDYLWLPSYSEINTLDRKTLWGVSDNQLSSYYNEFYLRTYSNTASNSLVYNSSLQRISKIDTCAYSTVRPALHLNLSAVLDSLNEDTITDGSVIYLDTQNGDDYNNGTSFLSPVKTIKKAEELVSLNGTIQVMNKLTILEDTTLGKNKNYILKRWAGSEFVSGYWKTLIEVGSNENGGTGNYVNLNVNVLIDGNNAEKLSDGLGNLRVNAIDVIYGNIIFNSNSGLTNFDSKLYSSTIYLHEGSSNVTINGGYFTKNNINSLIYATNSANTIVLNGGEFSENILVCLGEEQNAYLVFGGNITIDGAKFIKNTKFENKASGEEGEDSSNKGTESLSEDILFNAGIIKLYENGLMKIKNALFQESAGTLGGVILAENNSNIEITNSSFEKNTSLAGGAIYLKGNNILTLTGARFSENTSLAGGAIFGLENITLTISANSSFNKNSATGTYSINGSDIEYIGGGAILLKSNNNKIDIEDTHFTDNITTSGNGGALNFEGSEVQVKIRNSNFANNTSITNGGSIFVTDTKADSKNSVEIKESSFDSSITGENGGAVYVTENISSTYYDCYFKNNNVTSEANGLGGAVRGGIFYNSIFEGNSSSHFGGALYGSSAFNCTFLNNSAYAGGAMYGGEILNGTFVENNAIAFGGALFNPTSITHSTFSGNYVGDFTDGALENLLLGYGGAIYNTLGSQIIDNCIFTNNKATVYGGAIYNSVADSENATLEISNTEFTFNYASTGSAIYNKGKLNLKLNGEVTITNNVTKQFGAVYFAGSSESQGSTIVLGDSARINNLFISNNFTGDSVSGFEKDENNNLTGGTENNFYVDFANGGNVIIKLESNLIGGSKIGIVTSNFITDLRKKFGTENEYNFATYETSSDILTKATQNAFVSDNSEMAVFYSETLYNGTNLAGYGIYIKDVSVKPNKTIIYTASDYYGVYDGNTHTIDVRVFAPVENYVIEYSLTNKLEDFSPDPITIRDAGDSLTIWFRIKADGYTTTAIDKRNVSIDKMSIFYDTADIDINLWFGQTINSKANGGTDINSFVKTSVIDEDGNAVTADFILYTPSNLTLDLSNYKTSMQVDIIPKTEKYKSLTGITVYPTVTYSELYFKNYYFYPNAEEMDKGLESPYALNSTTYNIIKILPFLQYNKTLYFASTYQVSGILEINIDQKVQFARADKFLGSIFNIEENSSLSISSLLGESLLFKGEQNIDTNISARAMITNEGTLELIGDITISGAYNYNTSTDDVYRFGGGIYSTGTLYLEDIIISDCRSAFIGGGIYSIGTATMVNCRIDTCRAPIGAGVYLGNSSVLKNCNIYANIGLNSSTADATLVRGAGLYVTGESTKVTIEDSKITNNSFAFITQNSRGGGVYVEAGRIEFDNCDISSNSSYYGGGLFIARGANVDGENLRIETNYLSNGTTSALNFGAGVYIDEEATLTLTSGIIRSNGTAKSSLTHNIAGIGVYCNGTFNFATRGDKTSQITLNSDTASANYGAGFYVRGSINIYGGNISQNLSNGNTDNNRLDGTMSVGGTTLITGTNYMYGTTSIVVVIDNFEEFNRPQEKTYNLILNIQTNRTSIMNPIIVKADASYIPTWEEWKYINNKITITSASGYLTGSRQLSFDENKNEYLILFLTPLTTAGTYYFNPASGDDLKAGNSTANAWKTWGKVLANTAPGSIIIMNGTWTINDFINIDGGNRVLKKADNWAGTLMQVTGNYAPVVNISNLIFDGNKRKTNSVAVDNRDSYLNGGYAIVSTVRCTINLFNVIVRENCYWYGAILFEGSPGEINFKAVNCQFLDNTKYNNNNYPAVITEQCSNTNSTIYLENCQFRRNECINNTTSYYGNSTCLYVGGTSTTSKSKKITIHNCVMDDNSTYNTYNYAPWGKVMRFSFDNFGANERIYIDIDNCQITNNKDRTQLNKNNPENHSGVYLYSPAAPVYFNFTNNNYSNNFAFYDAISLQLSTDNKNYINFDNCQFTNNEHFIRLLYITGKADTTINNCIFKDSQVTDWTVRVHNANGGDITATNCQFYNVGHGLYTHSGANNVIVDNFTFKNSGWRTAYQTSTINGKLSISNFYADSTNYGIYTSATVANGVSIKNASIENCYRGIFIATIVKQVNMQDIFIKGCRDYAFYSNASWNNENVITAKNVYIENVRINAGMYLRFSPFYGENVTIKNTNIGIDVMGGIVRNVNISTCYTAGMYVYNNENRSITVENVNIDESYTDGINYQHSSHRNLPNVFKNVTITNCRNHAFFDNTSYYSNNLTFENCTFTNSYMGYYRWFVTTNAYSTNYIDVTSFINCDFSYNYYDGISLRAGFNTSSIYQTVNIENSTFTHNGRFGVYFYRDYATSPNLPVYNIDENTVMAFNDCGLYFGGEGSTVWAKVTGGQYLYNHSYGIYSTVFVNLEGLNKQIIVKDNGYNYYRTEEDGTITPIGDKKFRDVYASRFYLNGKLDVESIMLAGVGGNGIYINGSLSEAEPIKVSLTGSRTANEVVAQGNGGYIPTEQDFNKLQETNWKFKVVNNQLQLDKVSSVIEVKENVYYFHPGRTIPNASGKLPTEPFTTWEDLYNAIDENSIVYIMDTYRVEKNINGKNALFKIYIDPTLANPTFYFSKTLFRIVSGSITISDMRIDFNSNVNGYASSNLGGNWAVTTSIMKFDVDGAIAYIDGNSTLIVNNIHVTNLYCTTGFRLPSGSNRLFINNSSFENIYTTGYGIVYSEGTYVSITNTNFVQHYYYYIAYCNNQSSMQLIINKCNFYSIYNGFWFNGTNIAVDDCNFEEVTNSYCFYIYNSSSSSSHFKNVNAKWIWASYFVLFEAYNVDSYLTLTNVTVDTSQNAFYLNNYAHLKTITGTNVTVKNSQYAFRVYQYSKITINGYNAINNAYGMGQDGNNSYPNVTISLSNSKFLHNYYGIYFSYYLHNSYKYNITITDSVFDGNIEYAMYIFKYTYAGHHRPDTLRLERVDIMNSKRGLWCSSPTLYLYYCKFKNITESHALHYNTLNGVYMDIEHCDFSEVISAQAINVTGSWYTSWNGDIYIYYSHFSNNRYGSFYTDYYYYNGIYIYNSTFDKSSGSPYSSWSYCSVASNYTHVPIRIWGKVVIEAGIYINPGSYNLYFHSGNLEEGSYVYVFLNNGGAHSNAIAQGNNCSYNVRFIHADGWNVYSDGSYVRLNRVSQYNPWSGNVTTNPNSAIYFSPSSGNDDNYGYHYSYPVRTWARVEELNTHNVPVYIMSAWNINSSTIIDGHGWTLIRYYDDVSGGQYQGNIFNIQGVNTEVTIKNLTIHGNRQAYVKGDFSSSKGTIYSTGYTFYVDNATLVLQDCVVRDFAHQTHGSYITGSFSAENCYFGHLYQYSTQEDVRNIITFAGSLDREISFINCTFEHCRSASSATPNTNVIRVIGQNVVTNIQDCQFKFCYNYRTINGASIINVEAKNSKLNVSTITTWSNNTGNTPNTVIRVDSETCKVSIDDCYFQEDSNRIIYGAGSLNGGAIYIATDLAISITNCDFENLSAGNGAGIYITNKTADPEPSEDETGSGSEGETNEDEGTQPKLTPNITLNNLEFRDCFAGSSLNKGGAIHINTSSVAGGVLNLSNVRAYYVHSCYDAIYINMNGANINLTDILVDGSNYTQHIANQNAGAVCIEGIGSNNIFVNRVTVKNAVENSQSVPTFQINLQDGKDSITKVINLYFEGNNSINNLVSISGTNLDFSESTFVNNSCDSMVNAGPNFSAKVYNLIFRNNRGGFAVSGITDKENSFEISNITISNNNYSSGIRLTGTNNDGSNGNSVLVNNITMFNNTNMAYGTLFNGVNVVLKNSNFYNNTFTNSNISSINSNLSILHTTINYNTTLGNNDELDENDFISRGKDMFVQMPNKDIYSSGGISVLGGKASLDYVEVIGNSSNGAGGGIFSVAPIIIANSKVKDNKANSFGGGLVLTMDAEIQNSEIGYNFANTNGGGIWFGAELYLNSVSLTGNVSMQDGSATYANGYNSSISIINSTILQNTAYGNGGIYFVNNRGSVNLQNVDFVGNTGFGRGTALYLNSLIFRESNVAFSGNLVNGTLIHFDNVSNFTMSDFTVSGNYGYGEDATLFSFSSNRSGGSMTFRDGRIYGNKMECNASIIIDGGLSILMNNVEVTGNTNLYSGDLSSDNGKGGAVYIKNGTLTLEEGMAVDNWAEYGAWLYIGPQGKAIITKQEISNITTDAETEIKGVIYVEKGGELELNNCKILGISLSTLKGAINNNGHAVIIESEIYENTVTNSIIYNGESGVISLQETKIHSNSSLNGGAIYNLGTINFVSGSIYGNTATLGGAIYNEGNITLSGGIMQENSATKGGAIYNLGSVVINAGSIKLNTATNSGAGIYNDEDSIITMRGGEITLNTMAEDASSIVGSGIANYGAIYLYGGTISNNGSEETASGGGLYAGVNSHNHIENAQIINNLSAPSSRGANIYLDRGAYLFVKNSTITSGRTSTDETIMDINANNATIILDNVSFISSVSSGVLRADNSDVTIINSYIKDITPNENGSAFYFAGGTLVVENSTFENINASTDAVLHLDNLIKFTIKNTEFINNSQRAILLDISKIATSGTIENSSFSGNSTVGDGAGLKIVGTSGSRIEASLLIQTSTFIKNSAEGKGGAIYVGSALGAVVDIYDVTFGGYNDKNGNGNFDSTDEGLGNFAKLGGGAIYIEEEAPAGIVLKGEVSITYNSTLSENGGGVFYAYADETDYDSNIYGLSLQSGAIVVIQNNYKNSTSATDIRNKAKDNLHFTENSNKGILVAELSSLSNIGVSIDGASEGSVVVTSYKDDIPVTTTDLNVFTYDDSTTYSLKLDATRNAIVLTVTSKDESEISVMVSDKVYTLDGTKKTIERTDFVVSGCPSGYKILYSLAEDGEYTEIAPSYALRGEYTIWYKVVDNRDAERFKIGSVILKVTGRILSVVEAPIAYINEGDKLSQATFEFGKVLSGDMEVSGSWAFNNQNVVPENINTRYALTFTPNNPSLYENTVTILVCPTIAFSRVYYYNGLFYNDAEHTSSTGVKALSVMVGYLKDMGEIFFMSTYTVGDNGILEENILTDKRIYLARHVSFTDQPMIVLPLKEQPVRLVIGGGTGSIYIDGSRGVASSVETEPLFVNNGVLSLENNVYVRNITNTGTKPAVAHNTEYGLLNLNGCDIYGTYVETRSAALTGGSIYNEGTMAINGGNYRLNYNVHGNGGFIYNTGSLTINSGLFARNYCENGSGGCIYTKGGSVVFNGGDFIGNRAVNGGVICVDSEGQCIVNGANFFSNVAVNNGASIYNQKGNVIQNGGDFKYNVNLSLQQINNNENDLKKTNILPYALLSLVAIIGLTLVGYIVIKKHKKLNFRK